MTEVQELYLEPPVRHIRLSAWEWFCDINNIRRDNPNYVTWRTAFVANPETFVRRFNEDHYPMPGPRGVGTVRGTRVANRPVRTQRRIPGDPLRRD